jgi:fermentation-respiration switch protein FrsA (DUF1100 family)
VLSRSRFPIDRSAHRFHVGRANHHFRRREGADLQRLTVCAALALSIASVPGIAGPINNLIYPAPTVALSLNGLSASARLVSVQTADGLTLEGIAVPATGKPTLLVFHGNGSSAADAVKWFAPLLAEGYGVVAAEYRGYSGNPGKPGEAGLAADADAFFRFARATPGPLWIVGHSLGSGVAMGLARREKLDALITIGAFTRLREMTSKMARGFIPDAYNNVAAIPALDEPYFLIHGARDETVPIGMGQALHSAASTAGRAGASFIIMDADHHPSAAALRAVFAQVSRRLQEEPFDPAALPATIKLVPFGQSRPLNP